MKRRIYAAVFPEAPPERIIRFAEAVLGIIKEEANVSRQDRTEGTDAPRNEGGEVREAESQPALDL